MNEWSRLIRTFNLPNLWNEPDAEIRLAIRTVTVLAAIEVFCIPFLFSPILYASLPFAARMLSTSGIAFLILSIATKAFVIRALPERYSIAWIVLLIVASQGVFTPYCPLYVAFVWWVSRRTFRDRFDRDMPVTAPEPAEIPMTPTARSTNEGDPTHV